MKKVLLAFAVIAFFASCKKDYTCTCTETYVNTSGVPVTQQYYSEEYNGLSKSEAEIEESDCISENTIGDVCIWAED
jgi:hypothetical protein